MIFSRRVCVFVLSVVALSFGQNHPVPFVSQALNPESVAPGAAGFTLTVNGANFIPLSRVQWNGSALPTSFVNASRLTARVPAPYIAQAGTGHVTVSNPSPGGGVSNAAFLSVAVPYAGFTVPLTKTDYSLSFILAG